MAGDPEAVKGSTPSGGPMPNPGDEVSPGAPQTAETTCPHCGGSGTLQGKPCPDCAGSGLVTVTVGDA
ncbi:hypothetical protein [Muricoccus radiodurans]|uniref:hypothetical protein n=1 Tax=Muricoccus radiodurans TaxID=2231721 RepID=UPI003CEB7085